MLPQFTDQNPPVTPNNGNPNTVYNSKPVPVLGQEVAVRDYEYLGSPAPAQQAQVAPTFVREAPPEPQPVQKPQPREQYVQPTRAEQTMAPTKPAPAFQQYTPAPAPSVISPAATTSMGAWLPRFAIDTSSMGTQFSSASSPTMDYWRSRLQQITQPVQQPVALQEQVAPTKPVVTTQPTSPVTAPDIRTPVEGPVIYGPDPQFQTGQFGLGAGLGLANMTTVASAIFPDDPARARRAAETIARTYPLMNEAQRAEVEELDNPRTTPERRRSLLQRLGDWIKAEWAKEMTQLREDPPAFWGDALLGPGAGTLVREGIDIFRPDVDPMINEGRVVVGRTRQINGGDRSDERTSSR